MMDGLISNEAFINNADSNSRSSSSNDPLGVLLEAPLGAYRRLKNRDNKSKRQQLSKTICIINKIKKDLIKEDRIIKLLRKKTQMIRFLDSIQSALD